MAGRAGKLCGHCNKKFEENSEIITCEFYCQVEFHLQCANVSRATWNALKSKDLVYRCKNCQVLPSRQFQHFHQVMELLISKHASLCDSVKNLEKNIFECYESMKKQSFQVTSISEDLKVLKLTRAGDESVRQEGTSMVTTPVNTEEIASSNNSETRNCRCVVRRDYQNKSAEKETAEDSTCEVIPASSEAYNDEVCVVTQSDGGTVIKAKKKRRKNKTKGKSQLQQGSSKPESEGMREI